jgi:glycosyltransferase involved in cell wall biosynthesis
MLARKPPPTCRERKPVPDTFIVMSTYNGARFLRDQIDSLLRQTYRDWTLLVRDDGSSDETLSILERLASRDFRVELLVSGDCRLGLSRISLRSGRLLAA